MYVCMYKWHERCIMYVCINDLRDACINDMKDACINDMRCMCE